MTQEEQKRLKEDPDGLHTYEYLANHIEDCDQDLPMLVENLIRVDHNGQFTTSAARYLNAIDSEKYAPTISALVAATIEKDREHRYLDILAASIYGDDYKDHAQELATTDDNFRRLFKRLFPNPNSL